MNIKFSIIVPMYNVELYIEKCLNSCLRQDISTNEYEIIVVNDGSPDNSINIANEIASKNQNIHIVNQNNLGLSEARNTGVSYARGKYIWFVDSDDTIKENCLKSIYEQCEDNQLDLLAICAANIIEGNIERRFGYSCKEVLTGIDVLERGWMICCAPFTIYKRTFYIDHKLKFYSGIYYEDAEFTPRSYFYAKRVGFTNDILYFVTINPQSITRTINPKRAFDRITIIKSLDDFYHNVAKETHSSFFHNYISMMFNLAFSNFLDRSDDNYLMKNVQKKFSKEILEIKHLFYHLYKSSNLIYKIEGVLFSIFPKYSLQIYKLLKLLDLRTDNDTCKYH